MKKIFFRLIILSLTPIFIIFACTKEISDDIISHIGNVFSFKILLNSNSASINKQVFINLTLEDNGIDTVYRLTIESSNNGTFMYEDRSYNSGQQIIIETGVSTFSYIGEEQGEHTLDFTITNTNNNPIYKSEELTIQYTGVTEEPVEATSITILSDAINLEIGESLGPIDFEILPTNITNPNIIWSSLDPSIATIDNTGIITAEGEGDTSIVATAADGSNISESVNISVNTANTIPIIEILTAPTVALYDDETYTFSVSVTDPDNDNITYNWYRNNELISTTSSIGQTGDLITTEFPEAGTYEIRVEVSDGKSDFVIDSIDLIVIKSTLSDNILLYYPFNGNVNDSSSNSYNGTNNGAVYTNDRFGNANSAIIFDGIDDYVELPNLDVLKPNLPVSFSFWIRYDSTDNADRSVFNTSYEIGENSGIYFTPQSSTGYYAVGYSDGGTSFSSSDRRTYVATEGIDLGVWHHIVITVNSALNMKIYEDASNPGGTYSGTGGDLIYSNTPGSIGRHSISSVPFYFKGAIDEFRYWDRELTEEEISRLYQLD